MSVVGGAAQGGHRNPHLDTSRACGTCLTRVLEGEVDHRDMYLTDEEKGGQRAVHMPCCSRARSNRWCWICRRQQSSIQCKKALQALGCSAFFIHS